MFSLYCLEEFEYEGRVWFASVCFVGTIWLKIDDMRPTEISIAVMGLLQLATCNNLYETKTVNTSSALTISWWLKQLSYKQKNNKCHLKFLGNIYLSFCCIGIVALQNVRLTNKTNKLTNKQKKKHKNLSYQLY